ncbi:coiled-coil domain-containing protein 116 [Orycteropus afer afer]|uniref:Coiled-coil domain-containing protein 116 n=1 Tax=Orycteropus afer afer TaxID=1230840 RepID=A0AC54ZB43_ORYAF|nr:coiled-coil domain-containing protein 116 [Orycteropus afer afer]
MARCRHHSGYLADDEAGHTTYMARVQPPRKPRFPEMRPTSKLAQEPHPPSLSGPRRGAWGNKPFGSFLDFLAEGQVLDSLQTVVEAATERMATVRTQAGEPLVDVQDPMEVPSGGRRARARPSPGTVHRHRTQPSLCTGRLNNYPSRSSSVTDSLSGFSACGVRLHSRDSGLGPHGAGSLPPMKDRLLLERNLKCLLRLENKGKDRSKPSCLRKSLLWASMGSQASSQWTAEEPLPWFSGLLGSGPGTPAASELGPTQRELIFLKREFDKEMRSLQGQPASFDVPGYCSTREPYCTLDFLAKHQLFPALQRVVCQAVDKLSGARRYDGCPLFFPEADKPTPEPEPPPSSELPPGSLPPSPREDFTGREEPSESPSTAASGPTMDFRKSAPSTGQDNGVEEGSSVSGTQVATKFKLKGTPPEEFKFTRKKRLPSISSKSTTSHFSSLWQEETINFLIKQAVSLLLYKYKFESNLRKQLGFLSFPVTEVLLDLFLGLKKVQGSNIRLSSQIDWTCLLRRLEEAEWALQLSRHSASQKSHTESPSTLPKPTTTTNQDEATEPYPSLDTELLKSANLLEPKLSVASGTRVDSSLPRSKEVVNVETSKGNDDQHNLGGKVEFQVPPEPTVQAEVNSCLNVNYSDPL